MRSETERERERERELECENETGQQLQMKHMTLTKYPLGSVAVANALRSELVARDSAQCGVGKSQGEAQDSCHSVTAVAPESQSIIAEHARCIHGTGELRGIRERECTASI